MDLTTRSFSTFLLSVLLLVSGVTFGQIVSDGLNGSSSLFTLSGGTFSSGSSASGDGPGSSPYFSQGTGSYGVTNGTATLTTTANINTSSYSNIAMSVRLASFSLGGTGNGADGTDIVTVSVSPDGGTTYYSTVRVVGNGNAYWSYAGGTGNASTAYDGNTTPVDYTVGTGGGNRTTDGYSTLTITGLPSTTTLKVRITLFNNAAAERWVVDDFRVTGTLISTPTKFVITAITPSSPTAGNAFSVTVQSQDASNNPANVSAATSFFLVTDLGDEELQGDFSGTIAQFGNSITINNVILPNARNNVILTAKYAFSGDELADGSSSPFNVQGPATQLVFQNVPTTGSVSTSLTTFTVEARRANNTIDTAFNGVITLAKASGPGTLIGDVTENAINGVATFTTTNALQFNSAGTYTLGASSGSLTAATSGNIVITLAPIAIAAWDFSPLAGGTGNYGTSPLPPSLTDGNLIIGGLTRGSGVTTGGTAAANAWGGVWDSSANLNAAVTANVFATFTLAPKVGYQMSLDNIAAYNIRKSSSGPTTGQWQYSINGGGYVNIGSPITYGTVTTAPGNSQPAISLTAITALQNVAPTSTVTLRLVSYGATGGTWYLNDPADTTVNDLIVNGNVLCVSPNLFSVTGGGTYCSSNPSGVAVGLSGSQVGISYQLKRNGNDIDSPITGTGSAIAFLNQSLAGTYTVVGSNTTSGCLASLTMTGSQSVSVSAAPVAGSISGGGVTYCTTTNSTVLSLSGQTGTIQWQSSPDNIAFTNIGGATSTTYTATNVAVTTFYRAVLSSSPCTPVNTTSVSITVTGAAVAGSISGAGTVCTGINSTVLTLSGHTGTIQWQSSPDNSNFTNIGGQTATTFTATNLSATTYYRAVVTNGSCGSANTASVTITVNPASVAGTISGGGVSVCTGTNSTVLTLGGNTGTIQWQSSSDNNTFANISGQTGATYTATNLNATTYYRAVVTSSPCAPANTTSVTIMVNQAPVAGSISGAATVCSGTNSTVLTLSGHTGSIQWQSSPDNSNFTNIGGQTATTYTATNLSATTYYRAVLSNSPCAAANTASVAINVNAAPVAGSIAGATTVCSGTNSTLLTLSGQSGTIQWQSSIDNVAFTNIGGQTATTYTATNLTATTFYRAVLTNTPCADATTTSVTITVNPAPVAGSISGGGGTICAGTNSTLLTLNGSAGTIQWQSSPDDISFANISGANGTTYTATNLSATTYYRAVVSNSPCAAANTASVAINVNAAPVAGSIAGATTVCSGTNSTLLSLSGQSGTIQWQSSIDNVAFTNIGGQTATTYTATNLTATTFYRAVLTNTPCADATTSSVTITVNPAPVAGSISGGGGTICAGTNSTVLTLSGQSGTIQWQSSPDDISFANISGANGTTYTATNLSATTYYRAVLSNSPCTAANTASVAINVNAAPVAGSIAGATTVCSGTNSTLLTLSGQSGTIQWQSSIDNVAFTNIGGQTATTYTATNLTATTFYRAVLTNTPCADATTTSVTITVNPAPVAGSISGGGGTICAGTSSTILTLSGQSGTIQWQSSPDDISFANISGENGTTYTAANLSATTYYRAVLSNSPCAAANTASVVINVSAAPVAGSILGATTVCTGTNNTVLTLNGSTGNIQWQSSVDNVAFADIQGENAATYTASNLTVTTYYRAVLSSAPCADATTASVTITVGNTAVAGTISGGGTSCGGGVATLTLNGYTGAIQWQSSTDDVTFSNIGGATNPTYNATISGVMYYRAVVTNGACSAISASVSVSGGTSSTWNGSAWSNGTPDAGTAAIFEGNFTATADFNACSVTVSSGNILIPSGFDVNLNGAITVVGGSFTLANNANLLQSTNAVNSGNIIVKRNSSAIRRQDYTLWSSPVTGQNLLAFSPLTVTSPTSRFYQYNSTTNTYNSITAPGAVTMANAQGYLIRVANNHPAFPWIWNGQFTGVPHNGDYSYNMFNGGENLGFNLVGNPYPSPMSMNAFVAANNTQITQMLYFWRETNNNTNNNAYCTWSPGGGPNGTFVSNNQEAAINPNGVIQTGQGFFVDASQSGTEVTFTNAMRIGNNANQFFRPATQATAEAENHRIWLNVSDASGAFCQTAFGYMTDATNGFDNGIDGKYINSGQTELYSIADARKLVIQGKALPFMASDVVPLGFKAANAGTYAIAIDHVDGLFTAGQSIYIKDNQTGAQHLLNSGGYSFTTDAGEFASRFEILYQAPLGTTNPTLENNVTIVKANGIFTINSGSETMDNVNVFDIRGRLIVALKDINASQTTFTAGEANQVLIVKIASEDGQRATRKVIN